MVAGGKFYAEDQQILETSLQNLVASTTWLSGICATLETELVTWLRETPHLTLTAACEICEDFQHCNPVCSAADKELSCVCNIYFVRMVKTF
jgi:hypothetical protein